jgi:hypothetical protein
MFLLLLEGFSASFEIGDHALIDNDLHTTIGRPTSLGVGLDDQRLVGTAGRYAQPVGIDAVTGQRVGHGEGSSVRQILLVLEPAVGRQGFTGGVTPDFDLRRVAAYSAGNVGNKLGRFRLEFGREPVEGDLAADDDLKALTNRFNAEEPSRSS